MDDQQKQLMLEISLLLLHLDLPAYPDRQKAVVSIQKELVNLKSKLFQLDPKVILSMLNDLLKTSGFPHTVQFLTAENCATYIKNNPILIHLSALMLAFLASPLKVTIQVDSIVKMKDALLKLGNKKKMTIEDALKMLELCHDMSVEIGRIINEYELKLGRTPEFRAAQLLKATPQKP